MASFHTIERRGRADWALMTAIHDALRRDLHELLHTTAGPAVARARWIVFRDQLRRHLAAEHAAMWRPASLAPIWSPPGSCCSPWSSLSWRSGSSAPTSAKPGTEPLERNCNGLVPHHRARRPG